MAFAPRTANLSNQQKYRDVWLFVVLIPLINAINYYLTYTNISFSWRTLVTFLIDTITGYAAWLAIRFVILQLDRRLPYESGPLKRIVVQVILSTICALLVIIIVTEAVNFAATDHPVPASFYLFDLFIFSIWFLVVNAIYVGLHFYQAFQAAEQMRSKDKEVRREGFMVDSGRQSINIHFDEIATLTIEGEYVLLLTSSGKKFYLDQSLDTCETSLPPESFFRLNRQRIVHRRTVKSYLRLENGKLSVSLHSNGSPDEQVQVSRLKAPAFKLWWETGVI